MADDKRVILVHLYVEASPDDSRTADEIGDFIHGSIELGVEGRDDVPALLGYDVTLCDEIEGPGPAPKPESDLSLRPRPGESAEDVLARVERAAKDES
jgi:hypothetical protein